jgi:hypothetical protein
MSLADVVENVKQRVEFWDLPPCCLVVNVYQTTRRYILDDSILHSHFSENLKFNKGGGKSKASIQFNFICIP